MNQKVRILSRFFAAFLLSALMFGCSTVSESALTKASTGDVDRLIAEKRLPFFFSKDNSNALQFVIQKRNLPVAAWLIKHETCDVNHVNIFGKTALNDAVEANNTELISMLIEHGAEIKTELYVQNPVVRCVELGGLKVAQVLKENGAKFNIVLPENQNLIHVAAKNSREEIVPFLIKNGCSINAADAGGSTPLHIAVAKDDPDMTAALLKNGADSEKKSSTGQTLIFYAAEKGASYAAEALIKGRAKIEVRDSKGRTPFLYAYEIGSDQVAVLLLKNGASFPRSQLVQAASDRRSFYYEPLLNAGADITACDSNKRNVLHVAARNSDQNSLLIFLRRPESAKILNGKDSGGCTPLLLACGNGQGFSSGVRDLLSAGASATETDSSGNTALHLATANNSDSASYEICSLVLSKASGLIDAKTRSGQTALLISLENGKERTGTYFINAGANVNAADSAGNAPLHHASRRGMDDIVKTLVRKGAAVNVVNAKGETPVGLAAKALNESLTDYYLAISGINIDVKDSSGKTARDYLWALYTQRYNEAKARWDEYFEKKKQMDSLALENKNKQREEERKANELENENKSLRIKANYASSDSEKRGFNNRITQNNITILGHNTSATIYSIAASRAESSAREYKEKMDNEMKIREGYTAKMGKLNNIPRR